MADLDADTAWPLIARHDVAVATLRMFTDAARAQHVALLLDQGDGVTATLLECASDGSVAITEGGDRYVMPPAQPAGASPLPLDPPRPVPASAIEADALEGKVSAPLGAIANLALAVRELASAFGGRSVATADFATATGGPVTIAARAGEPIVLEIGEHQFELPPGWPPSGPGV